MNCETDRKLWQWLQPISSILLKEWAIRFNGKMEGHRFISRAEKMSPLNQNVGSRTS